MKKLTSSDFHINKKEKRDAYYKVLDFINSDRCYDGVVAILYGLRATGKTTVMQQLMADNSDRFSFAFLEATNEDTMDDIYNALDDAIHNKVNCVFIDEITNVPDFIDDAEMLAEYYAKEGIRIVLSGHDSLCFIFAGENSLYGKAEYISTTYISFEENMRVLCTNDINDYICYGGLTKNGSVKDDHTVYDYRSACEYLDEAVAGNIYRSLQCYSIYANYNALFKITADEMSVVLEIMVKMYSERLTPELANEELKRIVLPFELESVELFETLKMNKSDIIKEFAKEINADTKIAQKFDDDMIAQLKSYLIRLGFISATNIQKFIFDRNAGWSNSPVYKEYYLTQPTIKYHHLKNALEFVETSEYYNTLPEKDKKLVTDMLDSKLTEDMAKQIILYEVSNALPKNRYLVCKVSFSEKTPSNETGEYDMLIYDKAENSYYAFAIRNTTEPDNEQCRHLLNEKFKEIVDYKYGKREGVFVLYNGKPFRTSSEVMYLNISDFVKNIARCKDIKAI